MSEERHNLLSRTVTYLNVHAIYLGTEELARLSLSLAKTIYGPDSVSALSSLNELGLLYDRHRKYAEAEPLIDGR